MAKVLDSFCRSLGKCARLNGIHVGKIDPTGYERTFSRGSGRLKWKIKVSSKLVFGSTVAVRELVAAKNALVLTKHSSDIWLVSREDQAPLISLARGHSSLELLPSKIDELVNFVEEGSVHPKDAVVELALMLKTVIKTLS